MIHLLAGIHYSNNASKIAMLASSKGSLGDGGIGLVVLFMRVIALD